MLPSLSRFIRFPLPSGFLHLDIQAGRVDLFSQRIRMSEIPCWAAGGRDADGFWIFAVELVRKRRTGSAGGLCGTFRALCAVVAWGRGMRTGVATQGRVNCSCW